MASRFFRGFSKVFKGPSNKDGFKSPTKYATIGGVKPKGKISDATKKFKAKVRAIDKGLDKGIKDFKKENPKRNITDDQMSKIRKDKKKEMVGKETKEFLREKKAVGGIAGLGRKPGTGKPERQRRGMGTSRKPKFDPSGYKFPDGVIIVVPDGKGGTKTMKVPREKKFLGGRIKKKKPETKEQKSIKEKILPKKKKDRLEELRKELGLKKGGSALKPVDKKKNPGLAKLPTQVRNKMGYMKKGGSVRKFGGGKK